MMAGEGINSTAVFESRIFSKACEDVDLADVIALVRDFVFLGWDDESVAFDLCALVEVA